MRDYVFGRDCHSFTDIQGFRQPISLWGNLFEGLRQENKYLQDHKPDPKRLTRKDQKLEKTKKTGPPAEANDPVL